MNRNTTTESKENYTGKISFYIYRARNRNPLFLQRNLRRVLAVHKKQIKLREERKQGRMKAQVQARGTLKETPPTIGKDWSPREINNIIERRSFSDRDPVLRIDVTALRDRFAKFRDLRDEDEPPRKQAKISPVEASCALTIWDSTSGNLDTVVEQTRRCAIYQHSKPSGERSATIELSEPFIVTLRKLVPKRERASRTYGEQLFSMQLALMAANATDPWPPVDMNLPRPKVPEYREQTGDLVRFPVLVAKWLRLPRLPADKNESLLEVFASQDRSKYKPKLSLKIDAQWLEAPTPLAVYNSEWRNGLVSPESSSRSTSAHDRGFPKCMIKTEWIFEGLVSFMDRLIFDGYTCPLCNGRRFHDAAEFHFHLITYHDIFKFRLSLKFEANHLGQSVGEGVVRVEIAENYEKRMLAGKKSPDFRELSWVRPNCPFDLEALLKGDESWLGKPPRRSNLLIPPPQLERSSSREAGRDIPTSAITRPPDQVPDLSISAKKKFRVPAAPNGLRFYRTTAKCPLIEGDYVSESDDDIDEEWLLEKHSDTIDSFTDTLPQEKEFMQTYDRHMLQEDVSSDLHAGEALIRFCRANKSWLQSASMRLEFCKKAAALKLQHALSSTVIRACLAIINLPIQHRQEVNNTMDIDSPPLSPLPKVSKTSGSLQSKPGTKATEAYRPLTPPEIGHIFGRCAVCCNAILDMRENIRCANGLCSRPDHHLSCVGLTRRYRDWACSECKDADYPGDWKEAPEKPAKSAISISPHASPHPIATSQAPPSPPHSTSAAASAPTPASGSVAESDNLAFRGHESSLAFNATNNSGSRRGSSAAANPSNHQSSSASEVQKPNNGENEHGMPPNREIDETSSRNIAAEKSPSSSAAAAESAARWRKSGSRDTIESIMDYVAHHVEGEETTPQTQDVSDGDYMESEHGDAEDRDEFMEMED